MQQLPVKAKLKLFMIIFLVCFVGIITTSFMIDKKIESYIADMKSVININIEVINNTNDNVEVKKSDNSNIKVYINSKADSQVTEETSNAISEEVTVTSKVGLNIRKKPTVESEKVGAYNYGERVKVIEDHGYWYKTDLGFICKRYVN